ncbi:MAG: VacJ family lipoprotein [Alphaproteobacteria bacterium]|nr:VacJ family lipoprotein [Alphaproteobacteria bacterium]
MRENKIKTHAMCYILIIALSMSGCATRPNDNNIEALAEYKQINDPLEPTNRIIFALNNTLDNLILEPVAKGYRVITPSPVRKGVDNFLKNLSTPIIFANDLLQGELKRSGTTISRFVINTTIGILGVFDPASEFDLPYHHEDFGQTLAVWGIGEGPYLMLPFLGPSNPRDLTGKIADIFIDPMNYSITHNDNNDDLKCAGTVRSILGAVNAREKMLDTLDDLKKSSIDYYATIRTLYRQSRNNEIDNGLSTLINGNMNDFDFYDNENDFDFPNDETTMTEE